MIGVIGGMGPYAGIDLVKNIFDMTKASSDQEHVPLSMISLPNLIEDRTAFLLGKSQNNPGIILSEIAMKLIEQGATAIGMPCNTAHYWHNDIQKNIKIPILSMPKEVFLYTKKTCKNNSKIGILCTEATLETKVYNKYFDKNFTLISPSKSIQKESVNKAINLVKMGKVKDAERSLKPAVNYLLKMKCKKIILGCTEIPIAIFAYKSFKKVKESKIFIDPNLLLAEVSMKKYR